MKIVKAVSKIRADYQINKVNKDLFQIINYLNLICKIINYYLNKLIILRVIPLKLIKKLKLIISIRIPA